MSLLVYVGALLLLAAPAVAEDDNGPGVDAGTSSGGLIAEAIDATGVPSARGSELHGGRTHQKGPTIRLGSSACPGASQLIGAEGAVSLCAGQDDDDPLPVLTVGLIRRAFAELELPAGRLVIQPPDGLTLVNFDTNFYTTSTAPIARTVTLLGQPVTLEAMPSTYRWDFGDGRTLSTSEPGAPYPRLDVTHRYLRVGSYRPSLSTTYTGRYRVGGGAWQRIPGTVTIDGAGQPLRAIEAQPKLVGY